MNKPSPLSNRPPSRPKPDDRHHPTEDEFAAWCEHPVTGFVASRWKAFADAQMSAWLRLMTVEILSPQRLNDLRIEYQTRADAYAAFLETGLKEYERTDV